MPTITSEESLNVSGYIGDDFQKDLVVCTDSTFETAQDITSYTITAYSSQRDGTFIESLTVTVVNAAQGQIQVRFNLASGTYTAGQDRWQLFITDDNGNDFSSSIAQLEVLTPSPKA